MNGVIFDGPQMVGGYVWVILQPTDTRPGGLRNIHHGGVLTPEDRARLEPDSERDVKGWLAIGQAHELKAPKGAKE